MYLSNPPCVLVDTSGYERIGTDAIVMASDRDWTIVRPAYLVGARAPTRYRVHEGFLVPGMRKTTRADLADFLLAAASDDRYVRRAVAIASPV